MGVSNHHNAIPFNNCNTNFNNGSTPQGAVPIRQPSFSAPRYMNAPTHLFPMQSNALPSPQVHSAGGFGPQNCTPNINPMLQILNQNCQFQPPGQLFLPNQNGSLPNAQFCFGNPMQNANHLLSMQPNHVFPYNQVGQSMGPLNPPIIASHPFLVHPNGVGQHFNQNQHMPKYNQAFSCTASPTLNPSLGHQNNVSLSMAPQNPAGVKNPSSTVHSNEVAQCMPNYGQLVPCNAQGQANQVAQSIGPPCPAIIANPPFATVQTDAVGQNIGQMNINALNQSLIFAQHLQGNMVAPPFCAFPPQQTHINLQPHMGSQVNSIIAAGANPLDCSFKKHPCKSFSKNSQRNVPSSDMQKSQVHHRQKVNGKFGFSNKNEGKGPMNGKTGKHDHASNANQARREQRRSLHVNYSEKEIRQWKEERRKNYPSKFNVEKKLSHKLTDSDVIRRDAEIRRQQLKEILAKQAELGFEVPDIPAHYLSDSENQVQKIEHDKDLSKKGKLRNKRNRTGRRDQNDRFAKKRTANKGPNDSPNKKMFPNQREPTLLQKLLKADIKRDKSRLLQVFRFAAMNSFLEDWPEKPLKFPTVVVKEAGCGDESLEAKSLLTGNGISEVDTMSEEEGEIAV